MWPESRCQKFRGDLGQAVDKADLSEVEDSARLRGFRDECDQGLVKSSKATSVPKEELVHHSN